MKTKSLILCVSLSLIPSFALGQAKKKAPKAKPAAAKKEEKKDPKAALSQGPADASSFSGDVDISPAWFTKTDEAIAQLTDLIKSMPDSDPKATRMVQLAELYWQKSSKLHLVAVSKYNKVYDAWFMKDGGSKGIPQPKLTDQPDEKKSDEVMQKAISIYEFVIKKYPNNSRAHQAHYYLGNSYLGLAKKDQAEAVFKKLVTKYPQSEYIPDAYLALGEFYFENKKLPEAIENYTKAAKHPGYKNKGYAMYKLAWCYLNTGDAPKAVALLKTVVNEGLKNPNEKLDYMEQALNDLVRAYVEVGNPDPSEAQAYFTQVDPSGKFVRKFLVIMGSTLFQQGRDNESIAIYKRLINMEPMGADNLEYEGEILKAYIRKADRPQILSQLNRIVLMVKPDSEWVRANAAQMDKIQQQREGLEGTVAKYAREVYEEARKLASEQQFKGYQQAEQFCDYYLQTFPKSRNTYAISMMLAETQYKLASHNLASKDVKYKLAKYSAALESYVKVVEMDPKGQHLALAAESAVFSAKKIIEVVTPNRQDPKPPEGDHNPRELPTEEKLLVRAYDTYVKNVPKGPKAAPSRFEAAFLFYEYNQFDEALKRFSEIIAAAPASEQATFSARNVLAIYDVRKEPQNVRDTTKRFLSMPELAKGEFRKELQDLLERSTLTIAENLQKEGKKVDAANAYLTFVKEFPTSNLAENAYYNASVAFEEGEKVDEAIKVREEFIKRFPDSQNTPNVIKFLGDNHRKVTSFDRAADYYEMLANKHPKHPAACDLLYNAAFFRENLGETQNAIKNYRQYQKQCADKPDVHELVFTIGDIYEKKKDEPNAIKAYEEYAKTYGSKKSPDLYLDSKARIANIHYENGKKKEAYAKYAEVTANYRELVRTKAKIGPTGLGAAAKAAFYAIEPQFDEYSALRLKSLKTLAADIKKKITYIKPLREKYEKVVLDYKHGDWAVASLYQIGRLSEDFVNAVKEAPIPPELTDTQKELYILDLQASFEPVENSAIEYYQKCLATSYDYKIYSEFTRKCAEGLERIRPSEYRKDPDLRLPAGTNTALFASSPLIEVK